MKTFLITILTQNEIKEWDYEPNTEIVIPVVSNNSYNAERKFSNRYCGSEYPCYKIISIIECDNFLFKPILKT